jgi:hypothetical protein
MSELGRVLPADPFPKAANPGCPLSGAVLAAACGAILPLAAGVHGAAQKRTPLPTGEGG